MKRLGFAFEKLGFASGKLGFAVEKLGFAPEKLGFAPEKLQVRIWDLQDDILGRDLFGSILGSRKNWICDEIILWWVGRGIPPAQMNSMVPGIHLGVLLCPKGPLF